MACSPLHKLSVPHPGRCWKSGNIEKNKKSPPPDYFQEMLVRDGPNTTTTIIFKKKIASDATPKQHLMEHQMKNLFGFSVFHCVEGAFGASSGGTPKIEKWGPAR